MTAPFSVAVLSSLKNFRGQALPHLRRVRTCRFRKVRFARNDDVTREELDTRRGLELLDWTSTGRVVPKRNVSAYLIIIAGIFRKSSAKVLGVEHEQMIRALAPDRSDQAFNVPVLPGRADVGLSRIPIARNRALNAIPNDRSLSRMRYFGAVSHGNA
jgi:hypothetical protein